MMREPVVIASPAERADAIESSRTRNASGSQYPGRSLRTRPEGGTGLSPVRSRPAEESVNGCCRGLERQAATRSTAGSVRTRLLICSILSVSGQA